MRGTGRTPSRLSSISTKPGRASCIMGRAPTYSFHSRQLPPVSCHNRIYCPEVILFHSCTQLISRWCSRLATIHINGRPIRRGRNQLAVRSRCQLPYRLTPRRRHHLAVRTSRASTLPAVGTPVPASRLSAPKLLVKRCSRCRRSGSSTVTE